jgi:phosphatidylinositol alpha-1,6-mannosyltransferase
VLTVGRLERRKGQDALLRALPAIRQRVPDVLYAIVGDGEDRAQLSRLVDELKLNECVRLHGELTSTELLEAYQQCDLFALANLNVGGDFEGFGIVLLEAQACEKPVVAGDSGGTAETMDVPATGRIVQADSPNELSGTLIELLCDDELRARMGRAGREWVLANFDCKSQAEKAYRLFGGERPRDERAAAVNTVVAHTY